MKIEQITRAAGGGVFQCHVDKYLTVVFANDGFYKFIGISREDFLTFHGNRLLEIIQSKDIDKLFEGIQKRISCEQSFSEDICVRAEENQLKWMWINAEVVKNANGELSLYCIFSDVTQRRLEQEELKTVQQRYLFVLNHTEDMIFEWDYKTKEMYQMGGQDIRFNYRPTIKVFPEDLLVEGGNIHPDDAQIFLDNYHSYDKGAKSAYAEYRLRSKSGIYCWCSTSSVGVFENGELTKVMGKIANINGQKIQFLEMSRRAMCDPLTELYNRKATESLVEQYIETNPNMAAMLVIDLDNFKLVNDTLGHLYGDGLLNDVAVGIKNAFRDTDIVGRIGGDEFAVFLTDIQNIDTVHRVSKNILAQFERIFSDVKMPKSLTGSVGISLYPQDATSYTALVEKADIALYHAKNTGKNKYVFYSEKILSTDASLRKDGRARARRTPNDSQKREDLYKLALEKANLTVWIYDVKNARIQRVLCSSPIDVGQFSTENFPHDLVARGYIHADSVKPFLELHQKLAQGEQEVFAEICAVNPKNGELVWSLISYSLMTDECGNPDIAIGTAKNITNQKKAQIEYKHEMDMRMVLETDIICTSITNLTQNEVEQFRYVERPQATGNIVERYEDIQAAELVNIPNPNDRKKYSFYTREMLLELFSQGKTPIWLNFRLVDKDGRLIWVSRSVSMLKDAQSGNIFAYVVIRDIDIKKRQELSLSSRVVVDELTGAYEQETARELINNAIKEDNDNGVPFALINFNVDRYGEIMSLDDEASAQAVMAELADLVRYKFSRQLLGRFFSNQIFVLVQNISDRDDVINTVNEIRDGVRLNARFVRYNALVTLSAGVVFSTGATRDFDSTYGYAAIALDTAKKTGYNKCIVYSNDMKSLALAKHGAQEKATQTALRCALALAAPKDTAQKLTEVLGAIGEYYAATKTFLVESAPSDGSPNCIYNWSPAGVKVETGTEQWDFSQNFPYIYSCLMQNPIGTFNDTEMLKFAYPMDYQSLKSAGVSSLFVAIIKSAGESLGYLFVINSKRNAMDKDFFTTVCKFLTSELEKRYLHEKQKFLSHHDADTGLLNRNRYIEYAESIKEESLISMGVVSADINGLKKINNLRGHDYGDLAVKSIAVAISQVFSGYSCYRFAGDEFLVVCENISKTAFIEKVKELRLTCNRQADFSVSIGDAWSDVDIRLTSLVKYSDEKMVGEKQEYYRSSKSKTKRYDPKELKCMLQDIENGRYQMFLQPKISSKTGEISGAEALVRYLDEKDNIISPAKFVPKYEENGMIKHIDIFIMEQACKALRRWIDSGKNPVCVSLNLSRSTIISGDIIAKFCSIATEYSIPKNLLEIEITESFGDLVQDAISGIGAKITDCGFKLSLDDFGSKYSNLAILSATKWDTLKLDKSLVNNIFSNFRAQTVISGLLEICKNLNIRVVAEGVETKEQFEVLQAMGCDDIQGYYFNKPMDEDSFEKLYIE